MWAVAGILLGLVVLAALLGFHAGPHIHLAAGVLGLLAAMWLIAIAVGGNRWPGWWVLLSADLVISAGVGALAWKGLTTAQAVGSPHRHHSLDGAHGVAVTDLTPGGIVRVLGEQWSAIAANGSAPAGTVVQVLRSEGVRLEVWADELSPNQEIGKGQPS